MGSSNTIGGAGFPRELLTRPWSERLAYFQAYTVAHPALIAAKEKLLAAIYDSAPNSLILVLGPTGVGKTTLRLKIEQMLARSLSSELDTNPTRVPVVSMETVAPDAGAFNWRDHFRRLLLSMHEPLVPYKMDPAHVNGGTLIRSVRSATQPTSADYQYAVEQALRHRRPVAVLIDEAQHLAKIPSGRRLADQLDVIKSIASHTGTVHVLFGTYDLLAFRNLSAQLSRRCFDIHLRRYQLGDEKRTFLGVLRSFEQNLPLPEAPDLLEDWDYLYERSLGCVGILKEWLNRALAATARQGGRKLTREALDGCALSVSQCDRMVAEILEGERQMTERREQVCSLRARLGLETRQSEPSASAPVPPTVTKARPAKRAPRPGKRRPVRDRVGVESHVHVQAATV
ncbi:MAG: ATP-binding protein [Bryobacteraceae bacterium]|jgi:energy-coupling factor transporter ATP-binding protein EcfA2